MSQLTPDTKVRARAVVLISGRGSNLSAIVRAISQGKLSLELLAVISNRADAKGLTIAKDAGIATRIIDHKNFKTREDFDLALAEQIDAFAPDVVVLAGFMRLLSTAFTSKYPGRLVNIHPSLLPAYKGLNTHQRAIDDRAQEHGASVHFVTADLDGGPVLMQVKVPVYADDDRDVLAARVLAAEHELFPSALELIATNRAKLTDEVIQIDNEPLSSPLLLPYTAIDAKR